MSESYDRLIAVKAMVLLEIQKADKPVLGEVLVRQVEEVGCRASARVPDYDFVGWIGCTIWELLDGYLDKRWIVLDGERPAWDYQLAGSRIRTTEAAARFIEAVRQEAPAQLAYFD